MHNWRSNYDDDGGGDDDTQKRDSLVLWRYNLAVGVPSFGGHSSSVKNVQKE